jgi:ketosteroid isomerase-like protein
MGFHNTSARRAIVLSVVCLAVSSTLYASDPPTSAEKSASAADVRYWDVVNACDAKTWQTLVTDDLIFLTVAGTAYGYEGLRRSHFGATDVPPMPCKNRYKVEPLRARVFGDVAIVNGNFLYGNGASWATYTHVYLKRDGVWKLQLAQNTPTKEPLKGAGSDIVTSMPPSAR